MNQEPDPLLSSLCSICHISPHQYRCPRCATLTCSLPCIKRHKQWAQCNGIRDPAAYIKRSDLATPAGIDHDYNYLTSIEREFDKAEREATSRGVVLLQDDSKKKEGPVKGEANLKAGLERCRVIVARAPKGISRSKSNGTRWFKGSQCLEWTVEWVHPDGRKELAQCKETLPIVKAYEGLESMRPKKRVAETVANQGRQRRRKKHAVNDPTTQSLPPNSKVREKAPPGALASSPHARQHTAKADANGADDRGSIGQGENTTTKAAHSATQALVSTSNGHRDLQEPIETSKENSGGPDPSRTVKQSESLPIPSEKHSAFYLHTPSLPSRQTILALIDPDACLSSILPNRLVLEYPTIYVFNLNDTAEGKLPDGFLTEKEYYEMARKEIIEEPDEGEIIEEAPVERVEQGMDTKVETLDEKKLLEVLGKDLGAG